MFLAPEYQALLADAAAAAQAGAAEAVADDAAGAPRQQGGRDQAGDAAAAAAANAGLEEAVDAFRRLLRDYARLSCGGVSGGGLRAGLVALEKLLRAPAGVDLDAVVACCAQAVMP